MLLGHGGSATGWGLRATSGFLIGGTLLLLLLATPVGSVAPATVPGLPHLPMGRSAPSSAPPLGVPRSSSPAGSYGSLPSVTAASSPTGVPSLPSTRWTELGSLPPRSFAMSAVDIAGGYTLVFGGNGTQGYLGDTWDLTYSYSGSVFQGGLWADWSEVPTLVAPQPRMAGAMGYDAFDGTVVLFGGYNGTYLSDTWVYNAGLWTEIHPTVSPPAREFGSMTWDNQRDQLLLFGGKDASGPLNDTWAYANGSWTLLHPVRAPSPRYGAALVGDTLAHYDLLFGGSNGSAETWEFAGGNWTQVFPANSPPGRLFASAVYTAGNPDLYLAGGFNGAPLGDLWNWGSGDWHCQDCADNGPAPAYGEVLTSYPVGDWPVWATGSAQGNETWVYDDGWVELFPSDRPGPYDGAATAYDPLTQQTFFEGGYLPGGFWSDTWSLSASNWTELNLNNPNNVARGYGSMAWDGADQELLYFGGWNAGAYNNTFQWSSGSAWIPVATNHAPSPRYGATFVYDPVDGYMVLFGGTPVSPANYAYNDTWTYRAGVWTNITATAGPAPPPRDDAMAVWDARDSDLVLFGGAGPAYLNDTWTFVHGQWTEVHTSVFPSARELAGFAYDTDTGAAYLSGGWDGVSLSDLWAYADGTWTEVAAQAPFGPLSNVLSTYDASQNHVVIFGGDSPEGYIQRMWFWSPLAPAFVATATANATVVDGTPPILFTGTVSGGVPPYSTTWVFGDGGRSSALVVSHTYTASGTYVARLYVNDSIGDRSVREVNLTVDPVLTVAPTATPTRVIVGVPVVFSAGASGGTGPWNFSWQFGDGTGGFGPSPRHTYTTPTTYNVSVVVEDAIGRVVQANLTVDVVTGPLFLSALGLPSVGIVPLTVEFTSVLQGGLPPYALLWKFGDGATSQAADPTHTYNKTGTFEVTIYAEDSLTHLLTHYLNITVLSTSPLSVSPIETPTSGGAPLSVSFSASVQGGSESGYQYLWNFGDGSVGSAASETHTYVDPGIYTPTINVNDGAGDEATQALPAITVTATAGSPTMQVHANAVPEPGASPTEVGFTASVIGGTPSYAFVWSFGDGTTSTALSPSHTYPNPGFYNASLNVTDSSVPAETARTSLQVDVGAIGTGGLQLAVAANPELGFSPLTVSFAAVATGGSGSYPDIVWTYGDGQNGTGPYESHTYVSAGSYTVHAFVTDTLGNSAQASLTVSVRTGSVKVGVQTSSTTGGAPLPVALQASATGGTGLGYRYAWNFGDRTNGSGPDVVHTYGVPGTYVITVQVTDSGGNVGEATVTVNVTSAVHVATTPTLLGLPYGAWYIITPLSIVLGLMALVLIMALRRPMLLATRTEEEEAPAPTGELPEWPAQPLVVLETADDTGALTMAQKVPKEGLLVFSRLPPDTVAQDRGFQASQVWQLAVSEGENHVRPADLEQIGNLIEKHFTGAKGRAVVLAGMDMLLDATSPKAVRRLLAVAREVAQEQEGRVLVALNPKGMSKEDRINLEEGATVLRH